MAKAKFGQTMKNAALIFTGALVFFALACNQGDTGGGKAGDEPETGGQYVSDGGSGSTLELGLSDGDKTLRTAQTEGFWVRATDPQGNPLSFVRIFCESEHGIAIIDPSDGGVAFSHTNSDGVMSGVLGGLHPGSYMLECRAPEGFNLVARLMLKIEGDVPAGFNGWPGAAGGNLGGGAIVEPAGQGVQITGIRFVIVNGSDDENPHIDIFRGTGEEYGCDTGDGEEKEDEPYGFDDYRVDVYNGGTNAVFIETVEFSLLGYSVRSGTQYNGVMINPGDTATLEGTVTDFSPPTYSKSWAGTGIPLLDVPGLGTFSLRFTVEGTGGNGESVGDSKDVPIAIANMNRCEAA